MFDVVVFIGGLILGAILTLLFVAVFEMAGRQ